MKRSDRSLLTNWWFQIDWWILGLVLAFSFIGFITGIYSIHLLDKILLFYGMSALILLFVPMLPKKTILWSAIGLAAASLFLFVLTYVMPSTIHESHRWVRMAGLSIMPADVMKPAFVVLTAWFLTQVKKRADDFILGKAVWTGGWWISYLAIFIPVLLAMFFHPDLGNMFMYLIVFGAMIFWAGAKMKYMLLFGGIGLGAVAASFIHPHFRARILGGSDPYQVNRSLDAIKNGGLWGRGDESFLFDKVPMANNDFVFSGLAEMWGTVAVAIVLSAMFLMFCILWKRSIENKDEYGGLVIFGISAFFVLHIFMNILTAVGLFMKGTTLPFISYGGSSLIAFAVMFAIVLGIVRQNKWEQ